MCLSRFTAAALGLCILASAIGCSNKVQVTGRVTYENGQPLTIGQVIFTDDYYMGKSDIDKNGEYSIHSVRRNDGLRKGVYRAYITGAFRFQPEENPRSYEYQGQRIEARMDELVPLIDRQHMNPDTTGWVFDIQKKSRIDFIVYPPGEVPEDKKTEAAKMMFDPEYREKVKKERAAQERPELPKKRRTVNPALL